jgi:membrane-associated HD superfamily phosphohydrolase
VELTQVQNDLRNKQTEVDTCDPQGAQARKTQQAIAENQAYVDKKKQEKQDVYNEYQRQKHIANALLKSIEPIHQYTESLQQELQSLEKENTKLEQAERTQRRNFQDGNPQGRIWGIPGVRTYDDKVMLAFWITYGVAIIAGLTCALSFTTMSTKEKITGIVIATLAGYGLAYYAIATYA